MIPTGYRQNYLSALSALTHNHNPTPVVRMLDYAAKLTAAAPWKSIADATHWLEAPGAFDGESERPMRIPQPWDL